MLLKEDELVENPTGAASASRSEVIQMVAFIHDHIDELADRMSWIGRYGHNHLLVMGYGMISAANVQPTSVAVVGCLCSKHFTWIHVEANGLTGTSLEVYTPVISTALEDGLSDEMHMCDEASTNGSLVTLVSNRVVIL